MPQTPSVTVNPAFLVEELSRPERAFSHHWPSDFAALLGVLGTAPHLIPPPAGRRPVRGLLDELERDVDAVRSGFERCGLTFVPGEVSVFLSRTGTAPQTIHLSGLLTFQLFWVQGMTRAGEFTVPWQRLSFLALCAQQPDILRYCREIHVPSPAGERLFGAAFETLPSPGARPVAADWLAQAIESAVAAWARRAAAQGEWDALRLRAALQQDRRKRTLLIIMFGIFGGLFVLMKAGGNRSDFLLVMVAGAIVGVCAGLWLALEFGPSLPGLYEAAPDRPMHRAALRQRDLITGRPVLPLEAVPTAEGAVLSLRVSDRLSPEPLTDPAQRVQQQALANDQAWMLAAGEQLLTMSQSLPAHDPAQAQIRALTAQLDDLQTQVQHRLTAPRVSVQAQLDELQRALDTQRNYLKSLPE